MTTARSWVCAGRPRVVHTATDIPNGCTDKGHTNLDRITPARWRLLYPRSFLDRINPDRHADHRTISAPCAE
jgi:hypothetical protein